MKRMVINIVLNMTKQYGLLSETGAEGLGGVKAVSVQV